jgi:putrescine aminotransferase
MTLKGDVRKKRIFELFSHHVSSGKADFFRSVGIDFVFGERRGPFVWDVSGSKKLINCHCNGGVFNLGHANPKIVSILKDSLDRLDIGNHHLVSEQRALLAHRLSELTPGDISCTVFGVSGGEAIDLAIKLSRGYTCRPKIISALGGYHGHTGLALATGDEQYRKPFGEQPPGFVQVPFNDFPSLARELDSDTAAVIFETVPATSGMPIPGKDFYVRVKEACEEKGALLIMDEVQTGLGRTGSLWGIEHFDVVPDIMVIGKGLSGGIYPITATCFTQKLESFFHDRPFIHVSTFGGAEVGCPVALAVLDESSAPEFLSHVQDLARFFHDGFERLKEKHPEILVGLRQLGLMMGIEMVNETCGPVMSRACYDNGILSVYANNNPRVSQLLPPLIIDEDLAREIIERVDKSLDDTKKFLGLA